MSQGIEPWDFLLRRNYALPSGAAVTAVITVIGFIADLGKSKLTLFKFDKLAQIKI